MNYKSLIILIFVIFIQIITVHFDLHADSINNQDSIQTEDTTGIYIPVEDFIYSDHKRVTMSGTLPLLKTDLNKNAWIVGGVYTGIFAAQHIWQKSTIWDETGEFTFADDLDYALGADKYGHAFAAYLASYMMTEALAESGVSWESANIYGAGMGLMFQTYIELIDGFGENWGFSKSDMYANIAGSGFFLAQHYFPFLQNFTPKFMYIPAPWHGELKRRPSTNFNDDYSSHTMWLSVDIHNLLPSGLKDYWPSWLELSFGYAVRNLCDTLNPDSYTCESCSKVKEQEGYWGSPRFIVALDYNLVDLLPDGPPLWMWIRQTLNHMKMPSPAVEFGSTTKFYLLYPFQINF